MKMFKRLRGNSGRTGALDMQNAADRVELSAAAQQFNFHYVVSEVGSHRSTNVFVGDMAAEIPPEAAEKAEFIATDVVKQKLELMVADFSQLKASQEEAMTAIDARYEEAIAHQISVFAQQLEEIKQKSLQHIAMWKRVHKQTETEYQTYKQEAEERIEELRDKVAALGLRIHDLMEQHRRAIMELEEEHEQSLISMNRYHDSKMRYIQEMIEREAILAHAVAVTLEGVVSKLETQHEQQAKQLARQVVQETQIDDSSQHADCVIRAEVAMVLGGMLHRLAVDDGPTDPSKLSEASTEARHVETQTTGGRGEQPCRVDANMQTDQMSSEVPRASDTIIEGSVTDSQQQDDIATASLPVFSSGNPPNAKHVTGASAANDEAAQRINQLQREVSLLRQELGQVKRLRELCEQYRRWKAERAGAGSKNAETEQQLLELKSQLPQHEQVLQTALKKKKGTKAAIKQWLQEFVANNGREPTNEDKEAIKDVYIEHKRSSNAVTVEHAKVAEIQKAIEELQAKLDQAAATRPATSTAEPSPLVEIYAWLGIEVDAEATLTAPTVVHTIARSDPVINESDGGGAGPVAVRAEGYELITDRRRAHATAEESKATIHRLEEEVEQLRRVADEHRSEAEHDKQQLNSLASQLKQAEERHQQLVDGLSSDNSGEGGDGALQVLQQQLQSLTRELSEQSQRAERLEEAAYERWKQEAAVNQTEAFERALREWEAQKEDLLRQLQEAQDAAEAAEAEPSTPTREVAGRGTKHAAKNDQAAEKEPARPRGVAQSSAAAAAKEVKPAAVKQLEKKQAEDAKTIRQLQAKLEQAQSKLDQAILDAQNAASQAAATADASKNAAAMERKLKKQLEDQEKRSQKEINQLNTQIRNITVELAQAQDGLIATNKEIERLRQATSEISAMNRQLDELRQRAELVDSLEAANREQEGKIQELTENYKKEMALRKKYKNEIENMKGKIRVFARCRPMAEYELARGSQQVVKFIDDCTLELDTSRGPKTFEFDAVYSMTSTQEEVFEDVRSLVESCLDGYNVCVFAYGQTGSGKTFTMTGSPELQGLTPRTIQTLFQQIQERSRTHTITVSSCFVELYNDNLQDLYFKLDNPRGEPPKLEIKMDSAKMVYIKNVVVKPCADGAELYSTFERANQLRKVGATNMNAGSSRSHSIFSVLVECHDKTTQRVSMGKISLVDLAGSERADKTGATAERLREAQSINKSLSALGDVISALSENEKFIPYRNNKLTQVMQDSLGGNAKTLMFVNISPADYNADETLTSLLYATRVKKITNQATKAQDSAEVARLKAIIRELKAGNLQAGDTDLNAAGGGGAEPTEETKDG